MPLRLPPATLDPSLINQVLAGNTARIQWKDYKCELLTPLYGGGVEAGKVDRNMPVRASAIRGQLRFWWRLLAQHKWHLDDIRAEEFDLWGGLDAHNIHASRVWVRVVGTSKLKEDSWKKANAPYALFPARDRNALLVQPGLTWILRVGFDSRLDGDVQTRVDETLRWWASFGGVGARTRRGLGAVWVQGLDTITLEEAKAAGCQLVIGNKASDPTKAWTDAVAKLKDFRQKPSFARNKGPGRSLWPEPDAIRSITGTCVLRHKPVHKAGKVFPRAAFGLPIIFHFKDKGDPADHTLQAQNHDRLASPLILRPYSADGITWAAAALLLPHKHVDHMELELKAGKTTHSIHPYWQPEKAKDVPPLASTQGKDALSAFLEFFKK
ncbi:type III-B CRISPR module RAMP protein Cmr1 [Betaproteobacteria bacterium]|nr:type III-B CRISPR module RAMP protein Cmr1 [Betaproteobacteria bacterium]